MRFPPPPPTLFGKSASGRFWQIKRRKPLNMQLISVRERSHEQKFKSRHLHHSFIGKRSLVIYNVRGKKVMLDIDLADLYFFLTNNLNKAVKRNIEKFPNDFMFKLTKKEY